MIDVRGHVRIVDWGIARAKDRGSGTDAGQVKGKFRYMAPEQITGGVVGPYTDVYAAAVTFWELLAGKRVYDELDVPQLMMVVSKGQAPSLRDARRDLPDALVAVYERATASNPERRFRTARQAADALRACGVALDREVARQRLAQLPMAARLIDRRRGYERAVLLAKSAATEGDLEDAVLRALEEPDRVERLDVDRDAVADAERLRAAERGPRR
jgi:serine/threonine-protein kinase